MTETPKETAPGPPQPSGRATHLEAQRTPIHLTASPDLVDLALAWVANGSMSYPETPALLRQVAVQHLRACAEYVPELEPPTPPQLPITEGFVLVDHVIRPGVRGYRLAKLPANVQWRIRIGAFERYVHRTFVVLGRRLVRFLTSPTVLIHEWMVGLVARRARAGG